MGKKKKQAQAKSNRIQNLTLVTLIVVFLGLGIFALVNTLMGGDKDNEEESGQGMIVDEKVFAYDQQPVQGNKDASVKIVEFGDYKCPSCKNFGEEIYPQLKKDYLDNDKAAFYFINNQFLGDDSVKAGIAGEAVYAQDPEAFWKFHDAIFKSQGSQSEAWATKDFLMKLAKKEAPDIDHKKLEQAIDKETYRAQVEQDQAIAHQSGVQSVPALYINGKPVPNSLDYDEIKKMIERELEKMK